MPLREELDTLFAKIELPKRWAANKQINVELKKGKMMATKDAMLTLLLGITTTICTGEEAAQLQQSTANEAFLSDNFTPVSLMGKNKMNDFSSIYPSSDSGWAIISTMVSPAGQAYEYVITSSSGNQQLNASLLKWIARHNFKPASFNNQLIDSSFEFKFNANPQSVSNSKASMAFITQYQASVIASHKGDQVAALASLQSLHPKNLFEDSFYGIAQYEYFSRWGTDKQQMDALYSAILNEGSGYKYLPDAIYQYAILSLFKIQIKSSRFGDALQTYKKLSPSQKDEPEVRQYYEGLLQLQSSNETFAIKDSMDKNQSSWHYKLLKKHFSVLVTSGKLQEIKLRCEKKFALIPYKNDLEYTIPDNFGLCSMELIGDGGTQFAVIQS